MPLPQNLPPYTYCQIADMADIMSQAAIDLRTDDNPPSIWGNAAFRAVGDINLYLFRRYDPADLQTSYWITFSAALIAVWHLCGRRGNPKPASIKEDYKAKIEELKLIKNGDLDVPECNPRRIAGPVMSNTFVKLGPQPHVRVHLRVSTTTGGSPTAYPRIVDLSQFTDSWSNYPMA